MGTDGCLHVSLRDPPLLGATVSLSLYEGKIDGGAQPEHHNLELLFCHL